MLALMLFLQVAVSAQQSSPGAVNTAQPLEADPKRFAVIEGLVVNANTGEAVRKANITLQPFSNGGMGGTISAGPMAPAAPYAATTGVDGKFRIDKVEPGSYRLRAERQGFLRQEYGAGNRYMMGTTVKVEAGQELRDLKFALLPQAVITGRVLDSDGEPLARVQIQALRRRYVRGRQQLMPFGAVMTLDTGEFRISDLAPGRYWIAATYRAQMMFGGAPARNTGDKPEETYVTTYYPDSLDSAGAQYVELKAGQELPGVDIRMRSGRVYRIRGKVTGSNPDRNLRLMIMSRDTALFGFAGMGTVVKEDGTFEIGGVPQGSYYIAAMPMQGVMSVQGKVAVDVGQENVENVTLVLGGGSSLRGSIRIDGDVQQLERRLGKKVTFESVRIQPAPIELRSYGGVSSATANADGSFVLSNIAPDKYRLTVMGIPRDTYLKSIRIGDQDVLSSGFEVAAGTDANVQINLGVGLGEITGVVQDAKQQPASGAMVTLLPDAAKWERSDLYRVASTDQNGQFTLRGIAPGDYSLYAWEDVEPGGYMDPEFVKAHEARGHKVSVKPESQQQVTLSLVPKDATAAQ